MPQPEKTWQKPSQIPQKPRSAWSKHLLIEQGNIPLRGVYELSPDVEIAQKMIVTALLSSEEVVLSNVPQSAAIDKVFETIEFLGGYIERTKKDEVIIYPEELSTTAVPKEMSDGKELDQLIFAVLLSRYKRGAINSQLSNPDLLRDLGVELRQQDGFWVGKLNKQKPESEPRVYSFTNPTPLDMQTAILLSVLRKDCKVNLHNVIIDPVTNSLIQLLNLMGAKIEKLDSDKLEIEGVESFIRAKDAIPNDCNEACVIGILAAVTHGDIAIKGVNKEGLVAFFPKLEQAGVNYQLERQTLRIWADKNDKFSPIEVQTSLYPCFSTRWVGQMAVLMTQAQGESSLIETQSPDGIDFVETLKEADAEVHFFTPELEDGQEKIIDSLLGVKIFGPTKLTGLNKGECVLSKKYSSVVCLMVSLVASGYSELKNYEALAWYYPEMIEKLKTLGAKVKILDLGENKVSE